MAGTAFDKEKMTKQPDLMKRFLILMCLFLTAHSLKAQVISYDMIQRNANTDVRLTLMDAESSDPISWASVYLIPEGDTTVTHFSLSDDKGDVLLKDVPVGKYELNAEMIGYNPHKKVYTIKAHWDAFDLGIIKMEENPEFLDAARISAIGNPIVVKKDTIEFNAASFKVGENAMLEALLMGQTTLDEKIIISENYYSSVTAACNYLRYHNTNDFLTFSLNIMKNPELSATYSYVATCMAKLHDKRVKDFFTEVIASNDPGYSSILSIAKSYLQSYEQRQEISREDYAKSLPKAPEKFDRRNFVSLSGVSEQIKSGQGAELLAMHIGSTGKTGEGAELIAKHISSMVSEDTKK